MKKYTLLLISSLFISSCYSYKTYDPEAAVINSDVQQSYNKVSSIRDNSSRQSRENKISPDANPMMDNNQDLSNVKAIQNATTNTVPSDVSVKSIIQEKGYYQVDVFEKSYKMEAVKWQGDTIIGHVKGKPNKELKFHEKDIQNLKVRQFSKGRSDALTVAAYASLGVGVFLLLK